MQPLEELTWSSDVIEVTVLPAAGCRLHRVRAFGRDLLRTPDEPATHVDEPFFWGGYVMAPWTNRVRAGRHLVAGREVDLQPNFADGTAIHGLVHLAQWERTDERVFAVRDGGNGWPWPYEVRAAIGVEGRRLTLSYALLNRADAPMPAGIGLHPWFRRPIAVGLSAASVIPRNDDPHADAQPAAGDLALSVHRPLADGLDATWLDVDPPEVELRWPELGVSGGLRIRSGDGPHVAVASPHGSDAVAVEAVTNAPWGFDRLGAGHDRATRLLEPGERLDLVLVLDLHRD